MTLMVAYSSNAEGTAALEQGRELAARLSLPVVVFHLDAKSHSADRHLDPPSEAVEAEKWLAPSHNAPVEVDDLLDTARELNAEAIVVGVRRRSPVGKLIMGSQAQRIILGADAPVIAVKVANA